MHAVLSDYDGEKELDFVMDLVMRNGLFDELKC